MQAHDAYIPFVRQIMDWHRFCRHGYGVTIDPYITIDINTKQPVDVKQLRKAIHIVLARNIALRTQFVQADDGLLYQVPLPPDAPAFTLRQFSGSLNDALTAMVHENEAASIQDSVLFKVCLVETATSCRIRLYVHHLIAEPRSLAILKQELIGAYCQDPALGQKPSAQQYIIYKNQRLVDRYVSDLTFLENLLAPVDRHIFIPGPSALSRSLSTTLSRLCTDSYYHFGTKPGHSFYSAMPLPDANTLDNALRRHRTSLIVLLMIAFARVCRAIGNQQSLIGVLYNDGYSPQASQTIGHYMGESFIEINRLAHADIHALGSLQQHLFTLYKHAIFNYNLYRIDEAVLYRHCVGFINYAATSEPLSRPEEARYFAPIDTVHFDLDPSFCRYQDHLGLWWRFNREAFSDAQIMAIDTLFRTELSHLVQAVTVESIVEQSVWHTHE